MAAYTQTFKVTKTLKVYYNIFSKFALQIKMTKYKC